MFRIEDFVLGDNPRELIDRLAQFLGIPDSEVSPDDRAHAAQLGRPHAKSYGGNKLTEGQRAEYIESFGGSGNDALKFFGYATDKWGIEGPAPMGKK